MHNRIGNRAFERLALLSAGLSLVLSSAASAQSTGGRAITVRHKGQKIAATLLSPAELERLAGPKDELIASTTRALQRKSSGGERRAFHGAPALGTAVVTLSTLEADPNLRALLSRGIFGESGDGLMRFSTGNPNAKRVPEWFPDVRGIGIITPNGNLSATNQPAQIVPRGIDFVNFFHGTLGPFGAPFRWGRLSPLTAIRGMGKLLIGTQPVPDLLRTRYWGYPTVIGADEKGHNLLVARTVFTPVGEDVIGKSAISRLRVGAATIARNLLNPRFQSGKLRVRLFESGAQFEVGVQLYRDPVSTPLQLDGDKVWDVPEIPVARLTLRPQEQLPSLARAIEKNASFGPQHAENWETPRPDRIPNQAAGEFQTDRLVAYPASADERRAAKDGNVQLLRRVKTQK